MVSDIRGLEEAIVISNQRLVAKREAYEALLQSIAPDQATRDAFSVVAQNISVTPVSAKITPITDLPKLGDQEAQFISVNKKIKVRKDVVNYYVLQRGLSQTNILQALVLDFAQINGGKFTNPQLNDWLHDEQKLIWEGLQQYLPNNIRNVILNACKRGQLKKMGGGRYILLNREMAIIGSPVKHIANRPD